MNRLDSDFVYEMLKCCVSDKDFFLTARAYVKDSWLPTQETRNVWKEMKKQYAVDKRLPTIGKLKLAFRGERKTKEALSYVRDVVLPDRDLILIGLEQFIKQSNFVHIYDQLGDLYNKKQKEKAFQLFVEEAEKFANFSLRAKSFAKIFADFDRRHSDRVACDTIRKRIPIGIDPVDFEINGFETGEVTLLLGDSGVGKSIALVGAGIAAARTGHLVYHAQAEGTKEQCLARYDSCWTGGLYKDIKVGNIPKVNLKKARKVVEDIGKGEVLVEAFEQFGAATLLDVRNSMIDILKEYGNLDVVILDYLELFDPGDGKKYESTAERFRQTAVARGLKNLAMEFNVHVISVTQSTAIAPENLKNPDFIITRYNLSEDKGKVRPFDNFITINQTPDERDEQMARLFADKFREHPSGQIWPIAQSLARTRFFDRKRTAEEFIDVEEEDDE